MKKDNKNEKRNTKLLIAILVAIIGFTIGFFLSTKYVFKPSTDSDFQRYEEVAKNVYQQGNQAIVETPNDVVIEKTATRISVSSSEYGHLGRVDAKLENGKLVCEKKPELYGVIILGIINGLVGILTAWLLVFIIFIKRILKLES